MEIIGFDLPPRVRAGIFAARLAAYHPPRVFFPTHLSGSGMAKTRFGEYITLAVVLRRFCTYPAPREGCFCEEKEKYDDEIAPTDCFVQLRYRTGAAPDGCGAGRCGHLQGKVRYVPWGRWQRQGSDGNQRPR